MSTDRQGHAVEIAGLEKSFRDWPVLWDLDLTVAWGETVALFGANGAGKTTFLRILSTSARADAGSLRIAGYDLKRQTAEVRRRIGVVGHRSLLYDDLTPRENLSFYARLYRMSDRAARVDAALDRVGLSSRSEHRIRTLSNGMQKRAAIARAILHQPEVLLLDEPETGLDRESIGVLGQLLKEWTEEGRSTIFTTHDFDLGRSWGHRAAVLSEGRISFAEDSLADFRSAWPPVELQTSRT